MSTYVHHRYWTGRNERGEPGATLSFTAEELRDIADALGDHDGGSVELREIADRIDR